MNILCLENNPEVADEISRALAKSALSYELQIATSTLEFEQFLSARAYAIVIFDGSISNLDCEHLMGTIKSKLHAPIVLAVCDQVSEEAAERMFELGITDCIDKKEFWRLAHSIRRVTKPAAKESEQVQEVLDTVKSLSAARTIEEITAIVRHTARRIVNADGATFILKKGNCCFYAEEDSISPLWKGRSFPLELCVSGWAMLHAQQVVIPDIYDDERVPHDAYKPTFVKSLVMTPVRRSAPCAAIGTYWREKYTASDEEIALLQLLADTTSVAIENVNLLNELEDRVNQRTRELRMVNQELESFSRSVAHDLKNPLAGIGQLLDIIRTDECGRLPEAIRGHIEIVSDECKRLSTLVTDLLNLAKIADSALVKKEIDLTDTARGAFSRIQTSLNSRVTLRLQPDIVVYADPVLFDVALDNLISNACKYSSKAENPVVEVGELQDSDSRMQTLFVRDNGIGFNQAYASKIFEVFQRLQNSVDYPGSGIGLSTVQRIIHRHGGEITAEATPGAGATFKFSLPRAVKSDN